MLQDTPKLRVINWLVGFVLCGCTACLLSLVFWNSQVRVLAPILFLLVVVAVAIYFGRAVGIAGTLFGAAVFAFWLYPPVGSFGVSSDARGNLNAFLLGGLVLSYLLGSYGSHSDSGQR